MGKQPDQRMKKRMKMKKLTRWKNQKMKKTEIRKQQKKTVNVFHMGLPCRCIITLGQIHEQLRRQAAVNLDLQEQRIPCQGLEAVEIMAGSDFAFQSGSTPTKKKRE
ncbi:hypothetical protein WMY93_029757 [Mugilogobius chulae]|uniref:Uncharacterized protein n=1 Tax=Mugilogobius chulae TaxID=88201 RepID=A0AAW0MSN0_9GOBI